MKIYKRLILLGVYLGLGSLSLNAQKQVSEIIQDSTRIKLDYSTGNRQFTGIPSIAATNDGRLWVTWYAGTSAGEDKNNYVVLASSKDDGKTWQEVLVADPDGEGEVRAFDPQIWYAPDNTLWLFWSQTVDHNGVEAKLWVTKAVVSDAENLQWSEPQILTDGIMMEKPTVLSDGTWLLPVSTWRNTDYSARVVASFDKGKTWNLEGACHVPEDVREFDEHLVIEKNDKSLWMLIRTNYGIGESFSSDRGETWSKFTPSSLKHASSRFFMGRLNSGNLLLVKHGAISQATGRSHLMAFISKDDGKTWSRGLLIDERPGVSYPDVQQRGDSIYVTYDYNRTTDQRILMTSFSEEDILSEKYDEKLYDVFIRRKEVSRGGQ